MSARAGTRFGHQPTTLATLLAWTGLAGALIGFTSMLLATLLSPRFSWSTSALSDLGAAGEPAAWLFNGGLVAAGIVSFPFAWVLYSAARHPAEHVGAVAFGATVVALAVVGAFPSGTPQHFPAAVGYFALLTFTLWVYGTGTVLEGDVSRGLTAIWLGILHVLGWILWLALGTGGLAVPEFVGSVFLLAWLVQTTPWVRTTRGR